jgi:hypothetical protein
MEFLGSSLEMPGRYIGSVASLAWGNSSISTPWTWRLANWQCMQINTKFSSTVTPFYVLRFMNVCTQLTPDLTNHQSMNTEHSLSKLSMWTLSCFVTLLPHRPARNWVTKHICSTLYMYFIITISAGRNVIGTVEEWIFECLMVSVTVSNNHNKIGEMDLWMFNGVSNCQQ